MDTSLAAQRVVERHLTGDDLSLVLGMLFDEDPADIPTRGSVPLSRINEGTPVPPELREMVIEYMQQGYENAAIQEATGLSRQAVSGVISGYRRRMAKGLTNA